MDPTEERLYRERLERMTAAALTGILAARAPSLMEPTPSRESLLADAARLAVTTAEKALERVDIATRSAASSRARTVAEGGT